MQIKKIIILLISLLLSYYGLAQQIINGDFELNDFNICSGTTNKDTFNEKMHYVKTWSNPLTSIDVLLDSCINFPPISNHWMISCLATSAPFEPFSLELSESLISGISYELKFNIANNPFNEDTTSTKQIYIGLSNQDTLFGDTIELIEYENNSIFEWDTFFIELNPIKGYEFITISTFSNIQGSAYFLFDNFVLTSLTNTEEKLSNGINIYPNPSFGKIYFELEQNSEYNIYDLQGRTVLNGNVTNGENEVCIANLESGIYIVDVGGFKKKIIKQ